MALSWFRKNKNKQKKKSVDDEAPQVQEEVPEPESVDQELDARSLSDEQEQISDPEQPIAAELSDAPMDETISQKVGYFKRLKNRLSKTRQNFSNGFEKVFAGKKKLDIKDLEALEELLITSDIGVETTMALMQRIENTKVADTDEVIAVLKEEVLSKIRTSPPSSATEKNKPHVILVVGVNGVGKTTTVGKIAASLVSSGRKVLIAAADTFRAAAVEQLGIWAQKAGAEFVKHKENADPAAVAFDAVAAAKARGFEIVLIDTAGRLHTKVNLMEELKKIKRTVAKQVPGAPHEILLVLDATTGQNALSQARLFDEALSVTGMALTKLDGTAKGGIVIAICSSLEIPLQYIGIGEKVDDLRPFDAEQFIDALF
jgi:fused signal recognition particle receptor